MATEAELLRQLKTTSHTYGWGAIAVFDGAIMAEHLADHYSLMVHGPAALKPIEADQINLVNDGSVFATLSDVVLAAPRVSFPNASMQRSRMLVSYTLAKGVYTERSFTSGAQQVTKIVNLAAGRSYTFSFEVDLGLALGKVDALGRVELRLPTGTNGQCDVSTGAEAQIKMGAFLLEEISKRYSTRPGPLALGWIETQRGHTLPQTFRLRSQAKPGSTTGESAVVVLSSHPDGGVGRIPSDGSFAYLIPDGAGSKYSATVLVSADYPRLLEGEAELLFGQTLFPRKQYFSAIAKHTDTVDQVYFGRMAAASSLPAAATPKADPVGVAAQIVTREVGLTPQQLSISASSDSSQTWHWSLQTAELGTLTAQGASALYTPPETLPNGDQIGVQRVIAQHAPSGQYQEVCIVLQASRNTIKILDSSGIEQPILDGVRPGFTTVVEAQNPYAGMPGLQEQWTVVGQGTVSNGLYTAPQDPVTDIDVIVYEASFTAPDGSVVSLGLGYCIVQFDKLAPVEHWDTLVLKLKSANAGARAYANGMQQIDIEVSLDTGVNGKPVLQEEIDTLRLVFKDGTEVPYLPDTVEGLKLPTDALDEPAPRWGFKTTRNRFVLAGGADFGGVQPAPDAARTIHLYLHTTAETTAEFAVRLTDIYNREHTSNVAGGSEGEGLLSVQPRSVPGFSSYQYDEKHTRIIGGFKGKDPNDPNWTPQNPNNALHFSSIDYWHFSLLYNQLALKFVRLQWEEDGPGVRWESQAGNEDAFSYLGYMLINGGSPPVQQDYLQYGSALYDGVLYNNPSFDGEVEGSKVIGDKGDTGTLLISLHRVLDVYYRQKALIPGFDLERTTNVTLWDENGTRHRSAFGFEGTDRVRVSRNTLAS